MPLITTSISNLIQGVSQQPASVRFSGQCADQENALASVVDGLQKRPATQHIASILQDASIDADAKVHFIERDSNERYVVIIKGSTVKTIEAYSLKTGQAATINQKYRGLVQKYEFTALDGDPASARLKVVFTKNADGSVNIPLDNTGAAFTQSDGHTARIVEGGFINGVEYWVEDINRPKNLIWIRNKDGGFFDTAKFKLYGASDDAQGELQSVIEYTFKGAANSPVVLHEDNYLNGVSGSESKTTPRVDIEMLTTGDVTYVLNTKKKVAKDVTKTREISEKALVWIKQGDYEKKYGVKVKVEGETDATDTEHERYTYSGASQAKEGTTFYNTAKNAGSDTILAALFGSSAAAVKDATNSTDVGTPNPLGADPPIPNFTSSLASPQLGIIEADGSVESYNIYGVDGLAGGGIGVAHKSVTSITDLPKVAPHLFKIKVRGDLEEATDDRYVQFLIDGSDANTNADTVGQGSWVETSGPDIVDRLDVHTMPLVLRNTAENVFEIGHMPLDALAAGDSDTNPDPSFVDNTIEGMFQFKGRLGFLSGPSVTMTETKFGYYDGELGIQHYNFYRTAVTSLLDSDPIDVTVSSSSVVKLKSALAYQDNLVMFSDYGQFVLRGGELLTPKTVSVNPITEFDCESSVNPIALGSFIYFPFARGSHIGVREFTVNSNTDVFDANEITAHVPAYIPQYGNSTTGGIVAMTGTSSEELMAITDGTDIYVYKYFFSGVEKILSSWSKFTLSGGGIRGIGFIDSDLYIVQVKTELPVAYSSKAQTDILKLPLANKYRDAEGSNTHLDRRVEVTLNADAAEPSFSVPYSLAAGERLQVYTKDGLLLQEVTSANSSLVISNADGTTTIKFKNNFVGGGVTGSAVPLYVGIAYTMKYTFSEQIFKAASGGDMSPTNSGKLIVKNGSLFFTDTTHFKVKVTPYLRSTSSNEFNATVVQETTEGTLPLESNSFRFPVFTDSKGTEITIENDSAGPCNLQSAEFESFVHQRSRRYG
tara:strand:- start:1544 stop:4537 length:2994 start_codon:yes stop_codon:yes gene_type:complete